MADEFVPQDGVPIPPINNAPKRPAYKYPLHTMQVGQMIFLPGRRAKTMSPYLSRRSRDLPGTFVLRHCWMRPGKPGEWLPAEPEDAGALEGVGVWRTE